MTAAKFKDHQEFISEKRFTDAVLAHGNSLIHIARGYVGSVHAEDIAQSALLKAWHRRDSFDPAKGTMKAWLSAITHRTALTHLRDEKRHKTSPTDNPDDLQLAESATNEPFRRTANAEILSAIGRSASDLPEGYRRVVQHVAQGNSNTVIAADFEISYDAAKVKAHRAVARLRQGVEEELAAPISSLLEEV